MSLMAKYELRALEVKMVLALLMSLAVVRDSSNYYFSFRMLISSLDVSSTTQEKMFWKISSCRIWF